jgi:hypothetical protein
VASFGINYMIQLQIMLFVVIAFTSIGALKTPKLLLKKRFDYERDLATSTSHIARPSVRACAD